MTAGGVTSTPTSRSARPELFGLVRLFIGSFEQLLATNWWSPTCSRSGSLICSCSCLCSSSCSCSCMCTQWSLLIGFVILDLQDLLLPRFSGPSRGSQRAFFAERERGGGPYRGSSRTLGDPPQGLSRSAKTVLREPRGGPENLRSRRSWSSEIMNASNNDYWVRSIIIESFAIVELTTTPAIRGDESELTMSPRSARPTRICSARLPSNSQGIASC